MEAMTNWNGVEWTRSVDGWIHGTVGDEYSFEIKQYTEPSEFGINEWGKISKLVIRSRISYSVYAHYERGWDKLPINTEIWSIVDMLVDWFN